VTNIYSNRLRVEMDLQQPTGLWTNTFAWDAAKRLTKVTSSAGSFSYQYEPSFPTRLISQLSLPNTANISNFFDGNARLLGTGSLSFGLSPLPQRMRSALPAGDERSPRPQCWAKRRQTLKP
jgi:hypothetical protein